MENILRYGKIIDCVDYELNNIYVTVRIVEYNGKIYKHRMINGKFVDINIRELNVVEIQKLKNLKKIV